MAFRVRMAILCAMIIAGARAPGIADEYAPITVERRLDDLEHRLELQEQSQEMVYATDDTSDGMFKIDPLPSNSWMFDYEVIPGELQFSPSPYAFSDDGRGVANRLVLSYERYTGNGFRFDFWGFDEEDSPPTHEIEIENAGLFSFDLYKRLHFDSTELLLGAGFRGMQFEFSRAYYYLYYNNPVIFYEDSTLSGAYRLQYKFEGGGLGVFAEWRHPLLANTKNELAFVGRGSASLLRGEWDYDSPYYVVSPIKTTDTISILETSLGLEYRRRCGRRNDHSWYVRVEPELQRWNSSWLDNSLASSLNFIGTKIGLGFTW